MMTLTRAIATKTKVRFHLGAGIHFMYWQVKNPDGSVSYYNPSEVSLVLNNARLRNRPIEAVKIYQGSNKTVCAWIECDAIEILPALSHRNNASPISYNPRVAPYWSDRHGNNIDGSQWDCIYTIGNKVYAV